MGLYMIGRYLRLYPNRFTSLNKYFDLSIYFIMSLITTIVSFLSVVKGADNIIWRLYTYSSPFVVIASVYLFLFFTKLSFKSRIINWISISSFAAFLVHGDYQICYPFYGDYIIKWFHSSTTIEFIIYTGALIIFIFMIAVLIDKVRIFIWNNTLKRLFRSDGQF